MKQEEVQQSRMKNIVRIFNANPYLIFLINILTFWGVLSPIFLKQIPMNTTLSEYYSHYDWFGFAVQIIVTTVLYFVLRAYNNTRKEIEVSNQHWFDEISRLNDSMVNEVNKGFGELHGNDLRLDTKIHYVDFRINNQNLPDGEFIKKLHNAGFSKEDLEEIKVDEDFLKRNADKLLPRSVIQKYNEFKFELKEHYKKKDPK